MSIKNNTVSLQSLLEVVNALPEAGGIELPELSNAGSASDLLSGKQLIDGDGNIVTGNIPTKTDSDLTTNGATVTIPSGYYASQTTKSVATATQATPYITVNSSGLITASTTQTAGYVENGTKSATQQLTTQISKTITPSTSDQIAVTSGMYTTGVVTVKGDSNLIASNIAEGKTIFGVTGTHSEGIDTFDATASADEIMSGETAYVNGNKVTGTFSIDNELSTQDDLIAQIQTAVDNLPEAGESSGGGNSSQINFETCTVQITSQQVISMFAATTVTDGVLTVEYHNDDGTGSNTIYETTIENVLCGSSVVIYGSSSHQTMNGATSISTAMGRFIYQITATNGETATINMIYDF